jgi:hypothetical protein
MREIKKWNEHAMMDVHELLQVIRASQTYIERDIVNLRK